MRRRQFLRTMATGVVGASLIPRMCSRQSSKQQPNILLIMADDHAVNAVGSHGGRLSEITPTQKLDKLVAQGARMTHSYCTNSICVPSRASFLTGQYSHVNNVYTLADQIDPEYQPHLGKLLQDAGYETAVFGKWHLKTSPTGFDEWKVLPGQGRYQNPLFLEPGHSEGAVTEREYQGMVEDVVADMAIDWIDNRDQSKPFLAMAHFKGVHDPWSPPERYMDMFEDTNIPEPKTLLDDYQNRSRAAKEANLRLAKGEGGYEDFLHNFDFEGKAERRQDIDQNKLESLEGDELRKWLYQIYLKDYLRCVAAIDDNVGKIISYLEKQGLAENTVVIYTSDQGIFLGEHGFYDKRMMYEESLRIPIIVRYPGEINPGTVNDDMTLNVDVAPTILEYAGVEVPGSMQGRSFRSNLLGKTPSNWRDAIYYRYWMHMGMGVPAHYGIRTDRYKLIFYYGLPLDVKGAAPDPTPPEWELFDLKKDPHEMNNVYDHPDYQETVKKLERKLFRLKQKLGDTDEKYQELQRRVDETRKV